MPQWFVVENNKRRDYLLSVGIPAEDLKRWVAKWHALEVHCKQNGKALNMDFYDYVDLAVAAGIFDHTMIGKAIDSYQLGRYGDQGGYSTDNCRFITKRQNLEERKSSGAIARAIESRKAYDQSQRVPVTLVAKNGEVIYCESVTAAAAYLGCAPPNILGAIKRKGYVCNHRASYTNR